MGIIRTQLKLVNTADEIKAEEGIIKEEAIRNTNADFLVDTGAFMLSINEHIKAQLGLRTLGYEAYEMADGTIHKFELVGPVSVYFSNRQTLCRAVVLPGNSEPLLGAIPMEDMDVIINPRLQTIEVNPANPYMPQKPMK